MSDYADLEKHGTTLADHRHVSREEAQKAKDTEIGPASLDPDIDDTYPRTADGVEPKVAAAGVAGAVGTLLIFLLEQVGVDLTAEAAAALVTVLAFAAGYLKSP